MNYLDEIESQIVDRLIAKIPTIHRVVSVYDEEELEQAMKLPPSIAVRWLGDSPDLAKTPGSNESGRPALGQQRQRMRETWSVFSIARTMTAREAREGREIYLLITQIEQALMGFRPTVSDGCVLDGFTLASRALASITKTDVVYETQFWLTYQTREPS